MVTSMGLGLNDLLKNSEGTSFRVGSEHGISISIPHL